MVKVAGTFDFLRHVYFLWRSAMQKLHRDLNSD
jgi:hypothetical protein